ncbi:MAG: hypothetical protein M3Y66_05025 [Actinomycetota bacterium]|nr:hypothetical protein [Actinomycetota bacterium]
MTEYQLAYWRDLPSMVVARQRDATTTALLASRFQGAWPVDRATRYLDGLGQAVQP